MQLQVLVKHLKVSSSYGKGQTWNVQKGGQKSRILFFGRVYIRLTLQCQYHGFTFVIKALLISFLCLHCIYVHG